MTLFTCYFNNVSANFERKISIQSGSKFKVFLVSQTFAENLSFVDPKRIWLTDFKTPASMLIVQL